MSEKEQGEQIEMAKSAARELVSKAVGIVASGGRKTVQARIGSGEFVNIERETNMSGPIHTKGVLILQALLANRFAKTSPLSLSASIVFEQSYGGVDGDSASSTEYYCLLSAVANLPIKQNIATGSHRFGDDKNEFLSVLKNQLAGE